ncbi:MAG: leucine--tRNA ligase [Candidatus Lernaella stagnicola]|nr:leucine--tRNA ligase [Candidatus Lernaella stagnicola]
METKYDHIAVEKKWQDRWAKERTYNLDLSTAENPYYNLMMFPYPSAEGLHVGNCFAFTGADIHGRYMMARGYEVFEPMGFDAFGIHSENYALKVGTHPWHLIPKNVENFKENQLKRLGAMFDWAHEVNTTDPKYYRWTQWIFLQLHKHGLAYRKSGLVNWCPSCMTVISEEQVVGGVCERCDSPVTKKDLPQWYFRITAYAQRLLDNLEWIDWSPVTKNAQRRWIGRSEGAEITFPLVGHEEELVVFTTRPDTLYGATYMVLAPEHPFVDVITTPEHADAVKAYVKDAIIKPEIERMAEEQEKTGCFTGAYAVNPLNNEKIPIWISDYVLMGYGTGAIMAVPAHDTRDYEFAKQFDLPIIEVISSDGQIHEFVQCYPFEGTMVQSGPFDGMDSREAIHKVTDYCVEKGFGERTVNFRLRDWCISRQRYWGPPVPIVHCPDCGIVPVPEDELPVELPYSENVKPLGLGESPLAAVPEFVHTTCPTCGGPAKRDVDVMDNFLDSAWYFFRYLSAHDEEQAFDRDLVKKWLPVDMYVGGNEHAVLHLMYTRFITMAFKDMGLIDFEEPFKKFQAHGLLIKDGAKMSKSRGNVINPDEYLDEFGTDTFRTYLMFLGPFVMGGDFRSEGIVGARRFMERVWRLATEHEISDEPLEGKDELGPVHRTIKKVTEDLDDFAYNTAIAAMMELTNELYKWKKQKREAIETLLKLLQPFAPHIAHELFERLGNGPLITSGGWPKWDEEHVRVEEIEFVVQVNGKLRGRVTLPVDVDEQGAWEAAEKIEAVQKQIEGKQVVKRIFVPKKLLNIVVKG